MLATLVRLANTKISISERFQGRVTLTFDNTPWLEALGAVLRAVDEDLRYELGRDGVRLRRTVRPVPDLTQHFFKKEELPEGWEFSPGFRSLKLRTYMKSDADLAAYLTGFRELAEGATNDVNAACVAAVQPSGHHGDAPMYFNLLLFRNSAKAAELEAKVKATAGWQGAKKQFAHRKGTLLALAFLHGDQEREFDALCAKLRDRVGSR